MSANRYYLKIAAAACLWGCIGVFFKMLTAAGLTNMQSVALRVTVAAAAYSVWLLLTDRSAFRVRLRHLPYFVGTGLLSLVMFNWCYFNTIELSSMAVAAVLLYTAPVFVTLISAVLFKEKLTGAKIAALALAFTGCMLVTGVFFGGSERIAPKAMLLGIGSGFGYALYTIFGKLALRHYSPATVTLYTFLVAAAGVLPASGLLKETSALMTRGAVVGGLCIGVLCCILPYILYTDGLSGVEPGRASIIATLEPVVAAVLGAVFFHEKVTVMKTAGMLLVFAAIAMLNMKTSAVRKRASGAAQTRRTK